MQNLIKLFLFNPVFNLGSQNKIILLRMDILTCMQRSDFMFHYNKQFNIISHIKIIYSVEYGKSNCRISTEIVPQFFNTTVLYLSTHFCVLSCMWVSVRHVATCWLTVCVCIMRRETLVTACQNYAIVHTILQAGAANCCMLCFRAFWCWHGVIICNQPCLKITAAM